MQTSQELLKQKKQLEQDLEKARTFERVQQLLANIKTVGLYDRKDSEKFSYEELEQEFLAGSLRQEYQRHEYRGVVFRSQLTIDTTGSRVERKMEILSVADWTIFNKYHALLDEYPFGESNYYNYPQAFYRVPECRFEFYDDGAAYVDLGDIRSRPIIGQSILTEQWECYTSGGKVHTLEASVQGIKDQIDLIEKIGNQETNVTDSALGRYTDYQMEYELKKRGYKLVPLEA